MAEHEYCGILCDLRRVGFAERTEAAILEGPAREEES